MALIEKISSENFARIIPSFCCSATSKDSKHWSNDNPLWGHCAVVSLIAQDIFGGELRRASLKDTPYEESGSHYWNRLPDGREIDFTAGQFSDFDAKSLPSELRSREYVLSYSETRKRYNLLRQRVSALIKLDDK